MLVDDLLRFIGGPLPPSWGWLVVAGLIVAALIAWCAGVFIWTLPPHRLRRIPVIKDVHANLTRRRFGRAIEAITARYRGGELSRQDAATAYNKTLRSFLSVRTGLAVPYLHTADFSAFQLDNVTPIFVKLHDAQFNPESRADVATLAHSAEELISAWT